MPSAFHDAHQGLFPENELRTTPAIQLVNVVYLLNSALTTVITLKMMKTIAAKALSWWTENNDDVLCVTLLAIWAKLREAWVTK
jgi:hypothetical protein